MNLRKTLTVLLSLGSLTLTAADNPAAVSRWTSVELRTVVKGTSTMHDWSVESTNATGSITLTPPAAVNGSLTLPAKSLAGGPSGLNGRMYNALKVDNWPEISFEALEGSYPAAPATGLSQIWTIRGRLTVCGQSRELVLKPIVTLEPDGRLLLVTKTTLKMTDYGVKPPTFMGMVRTGDTVTIELRWLLNRAAD
jgi:hypothetical protein